MGKRKKAAKKPTGPKKNEPLPTTFPCLFCNHEKSVAIKIDKKAGVGQLNCKVCNQQFQCSVNYLSAPVDVYADWVDACDAVAKEGNEAGEGDFAPSRTLVSGRSGTGRSKDDNEDEDDMIDDDDGGGYNGGGVAADDEY